MFDKIFTIAAKTVKLTVYAVCTILLLWILISWIDIICHNQSDGMYSQWNIINIFFDFIGGVD